MSNTLRIAELTQIQGPVERDVQNLILDNGNDLNSKRALLKQIVGSGSGAANMLAYKEEITEITADMFASIADGSFDKVHVGMHYTAASGRKYWLAHADYFLGSGSTEQTAHHMVVVEDELSHFEQHQTTNVTTGGASSSLIYTTVLPGIQSELETDFGASHIKQQSLLLSNAVSGDAASGWAWADKKAFLLNARMVFGNPICYADPKGEMYNGGNRCSQLALFRNMPETIIARRKTQQDRYHWWLDDVESAAYFGAVASDGAANANAASSARGVRRAFLIG